MNLLTNRAVLITAGILIAFAVGTLILPPDLFKLYLDSGRVGVWATVWFVTLRLALKFFFLNRKRTGGEILAIAVNMTAGIVLVAAIWIPFNREFADRLGIHQAWRDTVTELIVLGYMVAGIFYLMPIGNTVGITPPRNYWFLMSAGALGSLVAGVMIGLGLQSHI